MTRRVLHLIPTLGFGGAEYQLSLLARHLPAQGWEVHVGHGHEGVHVETLTAAGAHLHTVRGRSNYDPTLVFRVARLIRRVHPALVQTWLPQMDVIGGAAAWLLRMPWIVSERCAQPVAGRRIVGAIRERVEHRASAVVSNSAHALLHWAAEHPRVPRFHIPNAISLDTVAAAPPSASMDRLRDGGRNRVAIAVGRLVELKRFDVFIDAMSIVCSRVPAYGVICGDGELREQLESRARAAGVADRIVFAGFVPDVLSHVKAAGVLVALSTYEGRPNAVIEAMATRTPLVVTDIPEHREVVGEDALFVPVGDASETAAAILDVFTDRAAAERRAEAARKRTEEWAPAVIAAQYAAVYDEVLRRRGRG